MTGPVEENHPAAAGLDHATVTARLMINNLPILKDPHPALQNGEKAAAPDER
jgi:hypothetical protein